MAILLADIQTTHSSRIMMAKRQNTKTASTCTCTSAVTGFERVDPRTRVEHRAGQPSVFFLLDISADARRAGARLAADCNPTANVEMAHLISFGGTLVPKAIQLDSIPGVLLIAVSAHASARRKLAPHPD